MGFDRGIYKHDYWREFARNPRPDFKPELWEEVMSRDELVNLMQWGYRRYYMRAGYIMKRVLELRSWGEFRRKARAGIRLLSWGSKARAV